MPDLDRICIPKPCPKRWEELVGDERRRFCDACALHVTNLSAMTRADAEGFLGTRAASAERACVVFQRRADGSVATADDRGVARRARLRRALRAAAAFVFGLVPLLGACSKAPSAAPRPGATPPDDPTPQARVGKAVLGTPAPELGRPAYVLGEAATPLD